MPRRPLRESDLRSLERRRMYTIFQPLDADEPLPREKLVEARRHKMGEVHHLEVAAALYIPALLMVVYVLGSAGVKPGCCWWASSCGSRRAGIASRMKLWRITDP